LRWNHFVPFKKGFLVFWFYCLWFYILCWNDLTMTCVCVRRCMYGNGSVWE
jgi:hypothetical protein